MVSVERVIEYTEQTTEAPLETTIKPESSWPENGSISFQNVWLSYRNDGNYALKNINFTIKPKEKVTSFKI